MGSAAPMGDMALLLILRLAFAGTLALFLAVLLFLMGRRGNGGGPGTL